MIAIMAMKQQRIDPVNGGFSFKEAANRLGIFGHEEVHPHQRLFNSPCMSSMPERKISSAFEYLSDEIILKQVSLEFREDLVERERLMKKQELKNPIKSKFGQYNEQINKNMDKPCEISHGEPRNRYRRPEGDKAMTK